MASSQSIHVNVRCINLNVRRSLDIMRGAANIHHIPIWAFDWARRLVVKILVILWQYNNEDDEEGGQHIPIWAFDWAEKHDDEPKTWK